MRFSALCTFHSFRRGVVLPLLALLATTLVALGQTPADSIRVEAETGVLTGVTIATTTAGYSGPGYVTGLDDAADKLTLTFMAKAGLHELAVGYASHFGDKGIDFQVNDDKGSGMLKQATSFTQVSLGKFLLKEGQNTVTIFRGWGYFDVDYILLSPAAVTLPAKLPKTLVDAQATPSTKGLFSYLVDQYGSKVISGQQDDVEYVLEQTGKEPAIGSFDLIDYSPTRVQNGAKPVRTSEAIIDWAKKGDGRGIVSLMWHWNAPTDLINQAPDKLWWRGFYTDATTFDLAAALADKNSDRYKLLLSDIDGIAVQLKKFQDADVPVLWRPLHEAPGGWFWWGAKGAEPFKALWKLLYDRLTIEHNLHNLIWVYTATDTFRADWYPGDQYMDIVGLDIYTDASANMSGNWSSALTALDGKKLVTLSESGNIPNTDKVRAFGTWWSWFATWTGNDYIKKQPLDQLKAVFTDADVITRDELPNWRLLAAPTVITGLEPAFQVTVLGNPVQGDNVNLEIRGAKSLPLTIRLMNVQGQQLTQQTIVPVSATARHQVLLGKQTGIYFMQVSSQTGTSIFRLVKL